MKIFVIIVHFKGKEMTARCLESINSLETSGFELETMVINNNPEENLSDLEKEFKKDFFLAASENLGFTGGYNLGIEKALKNEASWVLLINNDTFVDSDLLAQLVKSGRLDKKIGILGPKIYFAAGYEYHRHRYRKEDKGKVFWYAGGMIDWNNVLTSHRGVDEVDHGQYDKLAETDFVSGCAMLVRREVFQEIGLLDNQYFLYLEDADFCQRAKKAGFKVIYAPPAKLWHFNAGSSEVGGPLHDYFLTRNRLLFGLRFAPFRAKIALIRESISLLLSGRGWQKTAVKDFYQRKMGQGSWNE